MRRFLRSGGVLVAAATLVATVAFNAAPAASSSFTDAECQATKKLLEAEIQNLQGQLAAASDILDNLDSLQSQFPSSSVDAARSAVLDTITHDQRQIRRLKVQPRGLHCQSSSSSSS